MIYLVTGNQQLFSSDYYEIISIAKSLEIINKWDLVQFDTETSGRDPHCCKILCAQFGNRAADIQIVVDTSNVNLKASKSSPIDLSQLIVKARTNVGNVNSPKWKEIELPADKYKVDISKINYKVAGKYQVTVTVGEGIDAVSTTFEVNVVKDGGCGGNIESSLMLCLTALTLSALCLVVKKNKNTNA